MQILSKCYILLTADSSAETMTGEIFQYSCRIRFFSKYPQTTLPSPRLGEGVGEDVRRSSLLGMFTVL